jgi:hypothetical protein
MLADNSMAHNWRELTLLRSSQSTDRLAAPSHFFALVSITGSPSVGLDVESLAGFLSGRFGFQPSGLSEIPLYKEKSLEHTELDLIAPLVGVRTELVLEGGLGFPAIDMAKDILIFIFVTKNGFLLTRVSRR